MFDRFPQANQVELAVGVCALQAGKMGEHLT
jgi:hypothetical protein